MFYPIAHGIPVQAKSSIHRWLNGGNSQPVTFSGTVHLTGMTRKDTSGGRLAQAKGNRDSRIASKRGRRSAKRGTANVRASALVEGRGETVAAGEGKASVAAARAAEGTLIERVLAGERELFYELVKGYESPLYATALAFLKNEAEAEETVQEAVMKAFKNLSRFRREAKFSTWLTQIAINEARMKLRKARRHLHESLDENLPDEEKEYRPKDFADWREIPSETFARKELRDALRRAIESLPEIYRDVLLLRQVHKLSTAETASVLRISLVAVKSRLLRARLQVRDALAPGIDGVWSLGETKWRRVRAW